MIGPCWMRSKTNPVFLNARYPASAGGKHVGELIPGCARRLVLKVVRTESHASRQDWPRVRFYSRRGIGHIRTERHFADFPSVSGGWRVRVAAHDLNAQKASGADTWPVRPERLNWGRWPTFRCWDTPNSESGHLSSCHRGLGLALCGHDWPMVGPFRRLTGAARIGKWNKRL